MHWNRGSYYALVAQIPALLSILDIPAEGVSCISFSMGSEVAVFDQGHQRGHSDTRPIAACNLYDCNEHSHGFDGPLRKTQQQLEA